MHANIRSTGDDLDLMSYKRRTRRKGVGCWLDEQGRIGDCVGEEDRAMVMDGPRRIGVKRIVLAACFVIAVRQCSKTWFTTSRLSITTE